MISALQTKLLIVIIALLAGIVSYFAHQRHEQQAEQTKVNNFGRPRTPQEKKAVDAAGSWGNAVNKQKLQ